VVGNPYRATNHSHSSRVVAKWRVFVVGSAKNSQIATSPFCAGNFTQQAFRATYGAIHSESP
jgi:hypothetical protein